MKKMERNFFWPKKNFGRIFFFLTKMLENGWQTSQATVGHDRVCIAHFTATN